LVKYGGKLTFFARNGSNLNSYKKPATPFPAARRRQSSPPYIADMKKTVYGLLLMGFFANWGCGLKKLFPEKAALTERQRLVLAKHAEHLVAYQSPPQVPYPTLPVQV